MSATIHDVARLVGVSVKTVSRAINDRPDVSPATRAAVQEAVRALAYQPSQVARGLRSGNTGMIGLLVPDLLNPYYAEQARHLQQLARAAGYVLVISNTDHDTDVEMAELRSFIGNRVDGVIFMTGRSHDAMIAAVQSASLPTVSIGHTMPDEDDAGTYAAMRYLIGLGHRQLAYLTEPLELAVTRSRVSAFRHSLAAHGLPFRPEMLIADPFLRTNKLEGGERAMRQMLEAGYRPTAVCTSSDLIAMGILSALRGCGLRVPADISLVGCDDILQASFTDPPLTTIDPQSALVVSGAFASLLHRISPARWPEPEAAAIEPLLVVRASTGPPPAA